MDTEFSYERILCTGSNGFLGTALCQRLLTMENPLCHELVLLDLSLPPYSMLSESGVKAMPLIGNLNDHSVIDLNKVLSRVDGVIHLAGSVYLHPGSTLDQCLESFDGNIGATASLLTILPENIKYFIYVSTMSVYDTSNCGYDVTIDTPIRPLSAYGAGKAGAEKLLNYFAKETGIPMGIFRMVSLYGPGKRNPNDSRSIPRFISAALNAKSLGSSEKVTIKGDGKVKTDYLYIEDAVDALIAALETRVNGILNLGSGEGISLNDVFKIVQEACGIEMILEHQEGNKGKDFIFDIQPAQRVLNWTPKTSFKEGIFKEIRWSMQKW